MKTLIDHIRREVPRAFEREEYGAKRDEIAKMLDRQRAQVLERMDEWAAQGGFALQATPLSSAPAIAGMPCSWRGS